MQIIQIIQNKTVEAFQTLFNAAIDPFSVKIEDTSEDFEGHLTLLVFSTRPFFQKSHRKKQPGSLVNTWLKA